MDAGRRGWLDESGIGVLDGRWGLGFGKRGELRTGGACLGLWGVRGRWSALWSVGLRFGVTEHWCVGR